MVNDVVKIISEEDQKRAGKDDQYTFNIERDTEVINHLFALTRQQKKQAEGKEEEKKDQKNILTVKKTIGEKIALNFSGYSIYKVRETIQQLKKGGESLSLSFEPLNVAPEEADFSLYEANHLKGVTLTGKSGQAYWTIGNSFDFDIVIPKLA